VFAQLASFSPSSTARRMFSIFRSMVAIRSPASGLKSVDASQICRPSTIVPALARMPVACVVVP
jgi:hypothetical protein